MAEIQIFSTKEEVREVIGRSVPIEGEIQHFIENNMEKIFGVTFLKSEYRTTSGRMDSIGLDENNSPVIFEYKRSMNENIINQGLFYLDWLLDHKESFKLLVIEKLGQEKADNIDWSIPCVICIANNFTRYDEHAVNQMGRNIKLVKYKKYDDFILFEHINTPRVNSASYEEGRRNRRTDRTFRERYELMSERMRSIYDSIKNYILALGDDISENELKRYIAFKKIKNFSCLEIHQEKFIMHLKLNPDTVELIDGFIKDVRNIGHLGTGDLQIHIKTLDDFNKIKELINRSYEENM